MAKEDVKELPQIPAKRRQIEQMLDLHIAMHLARDDITPGERKRLQIEKERRKKLRPDKRVGIILGVEGATPQQIDVILEMLGDLNPTEVHYTRLPKALYRAVLSKASKLKEHTLWNNAQDVARNSDVVIAAPKETREPTGFKQGVWAYIKYAKHRSIPTTVVLPDGTIHNEE
jgi:hypothetical protein